MNTFIETAAKKICSLTLAAAMVCTAGAVAVPAVTGEEVLGIKAEAGTAFPVYDGFSYYYDEYHTSVTIVGYKGDKNDIEIPDTINGVPVTNIEPYAFTEAYSNDTDLHSVILPDSIKTMGENVFFRCENLKSVRLPKNMKKIPMYTFSECSSLEEIELPEKLSGGIGIGAFYGCASLKEFTVPDYISVLPVEIFSGCTSLEKVVLPDTMTEIGASAFENCKSLKNITLPSALRTIGYGAFSGCSALELSGLPEGVKVLKNSAFSACDMLGMSNGDDTEYRYFSVPASVISIESEVFPKNDVFVIFAPEGSDIIDYANNNGIKYMIDKNKPAVPDGIPELETDKKYFEYVSVSDGIAITAYTGTEENIYIPSIIDGKRVVEIRSFFSDGYSCNQIKNIRIADSVKRICDKVFYGCTRLKTVVLPEGLETIGAEAFRQCSALNNISLPDSIKEIGHSTFMECFHLKSAKLPNGLEIINYETFKDCFELESVILPEKLEIIYTVAFGNCTKLNNVSLPNGLKIIDGYSFCGCKSLESIYIPDTVTLLGGGAFFCCDNLRDVYLSANIEEIGMMCFARCYALESITIPKSVKTISERAFEECSIQSVQLSEGLEEIGMLAFKGCPIRGKLIIPETVKRIDHAAFESNEEYLVDEIIILNEETLLETTSVGYYYDPDDMRREISLDLVLTAKKGSRAEAYAQSIGLKFKDIEKEKIINYKIAPKDITFIIFSCDHSGYHLGVDFTPENVTNKNVTWKSSDESLVTVEKGIIKPVMYDGKFGTGNFTITATADNGISVSLDFIIYGDPPKPGWEPNKMYAIGNPVTLKPDEELFSAFITIKMTPEWKSDNEKVAVVDKDGRIKAVGTGKAVISAEDEKGIIVMFEVTVETPDIPVKTVNLNKTKKTIGLGEQYTLSATVTPNDAANKNLTWTTSDSAVATVSGGKVTAKKAGTATITAKTNNGKTATCLITAKKAPSKVTLNKTKKTIGVGEGYTLKATLPDGTASGTMKWTSSNTNVVTVKDGKLTAKKTGTSTITVKTYNGKTASCLITVKKAPSKVTLNKAKKTIGVGEGYTLKATLPDGTASGTMKWTSSNTSVVTVKDGKLTAKKTGTATITVRTFNGKTATCLITVRKAPSKVTLNKTTLTMKKGGTYTLKATLPDGTASGTMKWTTSSSAVVTVKDGKLTAKKAGTATITVKTYNGKTAKCKVTVK